MNYIRLRKLRDDLVSKDNKTQEELEMLIELQSLGKMLDKMDFSLALSGSVCKKCGRPL
jgi:predicted Zn-ribbon and HTH transcriptional regulator